MKWLVAILIGLPCAGAAQHVDLPPIETECIKRTFLAMQPSLLEAKTSDERLSLIHI